MKFEKFWITKNLSIRLNVYAIRGFVGRADSLSMLEDMNSKYQEQRFLIGRSKNFKQKRATGSFEELDHTANHVVLVESKFIV